MRILCSLRSDFPLDCNDYRMHSAQTHTHVSYINVTFCYSDIAQIHNKSTGQYITLYSCIVSVWLAPEVASLVTFSLHPTLEKSAAGVIILRSSHVKCPIHYNDTNNIRQVNITHLLARQIAFFLCLYVKATLFPYYQVQKCVIFFSVHMDNRQQNMEMIQEGIRKFICILLKYRNTECTVPLHMRQHIICLSTRIIQIHTAS